MNGRATPVAALGIAGALLAGWAAGAQAQDAKMVFNAQQEARGAAQFNANCSQCHGKNLEGVEAPALVGLDVMGNWVTAQGLYDYISVAMPPSAAGQLGEQNYIDIISHILAVNGAPAGSKPLALADLPQVDLVSVTGVKAGTAVGAAPKPAGATTAAAPARVPQAFTAGKQLPTVGVASPAATTPAAAPATSAPRLPQAFTAGKQLPTVAPGSTTGANAEPR